MAALLAETGLGTAVGAVLDPACGDGGFLVPLARARIACGREHPLDGIHGIDLDAEALLVALARLYACAPRGGVPTLERRDFLLDPPPGRFRLVLGNPPYRVNLPAEVRNELERRYETAEGEKDLYTFFIESGMRRLEAEGTLLMLTSHTWLVNHQCAKIRRFVFGEHSAERLFLLPTRFFPEAPGVIPVVAEIRNAFPGEGWVQVYDGYDGSGGWRSRRRAPAASFLQPTGLRTALADPGLKGLFDEMTGENPRLGAIARVGVGIQEALRREGRASKFVSATPGGPTSVPVLRGREIEPFRTRWEGLYLDYGPHLAYAGDPDLFRGEKILYQNLRHETLPVRLVAALDREGYFPKNSLSYITKPEPPFTLEYLTGLLNSPLVNGWFGGAYFSFHVTVTQVRSIPVPVADASRRASVEECARRLGRIPAGSPLPRELCNALAAAVAACYFPDKDPAEILERLPAG